MIKIARERGIAVIEMRGVPTFTDVKKALDGLLDDPDHLDGMDVRLGTFVMRLHLPSRQRTLGPWPYLSCRTLINLESVRALWSHVM